MDLRITNVVLRGDLKCLVNLTHVLNNVHNAIFNPKKYSGVIWQHRSIKSKCFLFHTGRIMCMGNSNVHSGKKDLRKYSRIIQKLGYLVTLKDVKVITKSAVATLSGRLDLHQVSLVLKGYYEPEIFMAVMLKKGNTNFTCFSSGKVVITGVKKIKPLTTLLMDLEMFTL